MPLDLAYFEFGQTEPRDVQEQIRLLQATLREQEIKNTSLQQQVNGLLLAERHGNETLAQLRAEVQELRQQQQDQTHPPTPPASPPLLSPPLQEQNPEKEPKQEPKQESEQEPKQELKQEVKQEQDLKQEREEREIHAMNTENRTVTRDERLHRALSAGIRRAHARGRGRPHGTGLADLRRPTSNYEWWSIWPWEWHGNSLLHPCHLFNPAEQSTQISSPAATRNAIARMSGE